MAINSTFYDGTVDEIAFSTGISRVGSSEYGVAGVEDYKVTAVSGVDRTVSIAPGAAWGKGIHDVLTAAQTIAIPSVSSGSRWDLIAVHRVWGTNTTTIIRIAGGSTKVIPSRATGYGTIDDQPIALVRVTAGATTIQEIVDLRCWSGSGGMSAADELSLSYLSQPGGRVLINGADWFCSIVSGSPAWSKFGAAGAFPLHAVGSRIMGPTPPEGTQFLMVAGSYVQKTDNSGFGRITWPRPFPNGLVTVILTDGDDASDTRVSYVAVAGRGHIFGQSGHGSQTDVVYAKLGAGATASAPWGLMPATWTRINYIAIGW